MNPLQANADPPSDRMMQLVSNFILGWVPVDLKFAECVRKLVAKRVGFQGN